MNSERSLVVSGLMFLVAVKSFEVFNQVLPGVLKACDLGPRFAASLLASTSVVAMLLSLALSGVYFKKFLDNFCRE